MSKRIWCYLLVFLMLGVCTAAYSNPDPAPAPSAFNFFVVDGIDMSPASFSSSQSTSAYTLTLAGDAWLLYNGNKYSITNIWGFYAVNKTGQAVNSLTAGGQAIEGWAWDYHQDSNTGKLDVAGWRDVDKSNAVLAGGAPGTFTFTSLSYTGQDPLLGLHVTISIPDDLPSPFGVDPDTGAKISTGNIIPTPEPSGLAALLSMSAAGLGSIMLRKRK